MTTLRRHWPALALLVAAPFLFHWPLLVPGAGRHFFAPGDFVDQFYAFASFEVRELAAGRLPLWNPHAYAGAPFWADVQAAVAYPPSLVMALAAAKLWARLPFGWLELEALGHLSLAGAWTFLFARRHLRRDGDADGSYVPLVAALSFQLGGYLNGYPPLQFAILKTVTWLPLALIGVDRVIEASSSSRSRDGRGGELLLGVACGLILLAGHPQSAMQCLYLCGVYGAWRLSAFRQAARRAALKQAVGSLAVGMVFALGLSAAGWLPAAQFWQLSNRAAASYEQLANGFPPRELLGVLVAGITQWSPLYVGVLPLLLAVAGGWWALTTPSRGPSTVGDAPTAGAGGSAVPAAPVARAVDPAPAPFGRFWLVVLVVGLGLSLGRHSFAFDLAYLVAPGFNLFRGQERAALWVSFALAMLAGCGARAWWTFRARGSMKERDAHKTTIQARDADDSAELEAHDDMAVVGADLVRRVVVYGSMGIAGLAVLLLMAGAADLRPAALRLLFAAGGAALAAAVWPADDQPVRQTADRSAGQMADRSAPRRGESRNTSRAAQAPAEGPRPFGFAAGLVVALVVISLDLYSAGGQTNLSAVAPGELAVSPIIAALRTGAQRIQNDDALPPNFGVLHELDAVSGASPLRLRSFEALRDGLADSPAVWRQLLAVSDWVTQQPDPGEGAENVLAAKDGPATLYLHRFELSSPYAWPVRRVEWAHDDAAALVRLRESDFNPSNMAVLTGDGPVAERASKSNGVEGADGAAAATAGAMEGAAGGAERAAGAADAGFQTSEVTVVTRRAGEVAAMMTSEAPGWLVFSEMYYPDWRATVDGLPAPVVRADVALMAVPVPAGSHRVQLTFTAPLVWAGILISLASTLALVYGGLLNLSLLGRRRSTK